MPTCPDCPVSAFTRLHLVLGSGLFSILNVRFCMFTPQLLSPAASLSYSQQSKTRKPFERHTRYPRLISGTETREDQASRERDREENVPARGIKGKRRRSATRQAKTPNRCLTWMMQMEMLISLRSSQPLSLALARSTCTLFSRACARAILCMVVPRCDCLCRWPCC